MGNNADSLWFGLGLRLRCSLGPGLGRPLGLAWRGGAFVLLLWFLAWCRVAPVQALESPTRWTLQDRLGGRWGLELLSQSDRSYPPGWRLRLNAMGGQRPLDHQRPLRLEDGQGGFWELANLSQELVPVGPAPLPTTAAQFDAAGLQPAPTGFLPLRLQVPLETVDAAPDAELTLGPDQVMALRELAEQLIREAGSGAAVRAVPAAA